MSLERRKALLDVAKEHDLLIVEDSAYNFMRYEGEARPPLKALDDEGRVIVVGTFSKIMGTGFRVGWLIAGNVIGKKVLMEKSPIDFCAPPTISQYIALEYLRRGYFEEYHLKRALPGYRKKRDAMLNALKDNLPDAEFTRPIAGMFIMLFLPPEGPMDGLCHGAYAGNRRRGGAREAVLHGRERGGKRASPEFLPAGGGRDTGGHREACGVLSPEVLMAFPLFSPSRETLLKLGGG